MQNIYKIIFLFVAFSAVTIATAQIPNLYFETFNTKTFDKLSSWESTQLFVEKTTGKSGSNAVKLTVSVQNGNVISGFISQNNSTGLFPAGPAFPYTDAPDSMIVIYKAKLNGDTANILMGFNNKNVGIPLYFAEAEIIDNTDVWKRMAVAIDKTGVSINPDSAFILVDPNAGGNANGYIIIDEIILKKTGNAACADFPNNKFENWSTASQTTPGEWSTTDEIFGQLGYNVNGITKTTTTHSGTGAVSIKPVSLDGEIYNSIMITGKDIFADLNTPTFPINARNKSIRGYWQSNFVGSDRFLLELAVFFKGAKVGTARFENNTNNAGYQLFETDITYIGTFSGIPDSGVIQMQVCNESYDSANSVNSYVYVDDLAFSAFPANNKKTVFNGISIFPNPNNGEFSIQHLPVNTKGIYIYNAAGVLVKSIPNYAGETINIRNLGAGMYTLKAITPDLQLSTKIIVNK